MLEPTSPRRRGRRAVAAAALGSVVLAGVAVGFSTTHASGGVSARPAPDLRSVSSAASPASSAVSPDSDRRLARAALGREIFFDTTLSEPPGESCASCHDPAHGFAGNNGSTIGVPRGSRRDHFARRSTLSVPYLKFVPRFHVRFEEDVDLPDGVGGFFWDGRADSIAALVQQPLLNPDEMNLRDIQQIAERLRAAPYADGLRSEFKGALETPEGAAAALGPRSMPFSRATRCPPSRPSTTTTCAGR
jgi:cytochrome c peroxidase